MLYLVPDSGPGQQCFYSVPSQNPTVNIITSFFPISFISDPIKGVITRIVNKNYNMFTTVNQRSATPALLCSQSHVVNKTSHYFLKTHLLLKVRAREGVGRRKRMVFPSNDSSWLVMARIKPGKIRSTVWVNSTVQRT